MCCTLRGLSYPIILLSAALVVVACRGGVSEDLRTYTEDMETWFAESPYFLFGNDGPSLRDELQGIQAPPSMSSAHRLLVAAYESYVLSHETTERLRGRDLRAAQAIGNDEIPQCVSPDDPGYRRIATNSAELDNACDQRMEAQDAYLEAEFLWAEGLAKACDLAATIDALGATQDCLSR